MNKKDTQILVLKIVEMETVTGVSSNSCNTLAELTCDEETFKWTDAEIARLIQIIFRQILVVVGTIGNGLTIYIMRRTSFKDLSSCFYMFVLALADTSK